MRQSLEGTVAADTSVAVLRIHTGLDVERLGKAFKRVLVADELLVDARRVLHSADRMRSYILSYDPGFAMLFAMSSLSSNGSKNKGISSTW